jgi:hypothetical protein
VTSERLVRVLVLMVILGLGALLAHLRPSPEAAHQLGFEPSLWLTRRGDLMIQLGLLLVGALGIRALLPSSDEEGDNHGTTD